ncbi:hypothetical protein FB45DRAFT_1028981 [Roridomyces roridus]|uniref:Ribonuclease H1 N-terminal domain-containing protein n=1 Tax=Roridomyces roridus TaxID=1738132 RepID=A0AAD7BS62_9AGAR|nr:hypothetical protein FB45DRAFT_1028981 [Roridomyces roridus]
MHNGLDTALRQLALDDEPIYFGDPSVKHREDLNFYVVIRGFVPGIYDTWAEAGPQTTGYPGNIHNKYHGWKAAVAAWNRGFRDLGLVPPSTSSIPTSLTASSTLSTACSTPSTPSTVRHMATPPPANAAPSRRRHTNTRAPPSSSVPSTPTRSRDPTLFVVSGAEDATIYVDRARAIGATRDKLVEGSLQAVDVTRSVERAFRQAEATVRECFVISSDEETYLGHAGLFFPSSSTTYFFYSTAMGGQASGTA